MKKWWLLLVTGIAFSANSAILIPEKGVSVLYINGVETEKSIGQQQVKSGDIEAIVRFDKDFSRSGSKNRFTSSPYVVKFSVSGSEVKLLHPIARSYQEAENAFRHNQPQWTVEQDGKEIAYQQELLPPNDGLFPYLGMDKIVADYYSKKSNTMTQATAIVATSTVVAAGEVSEPQATSSQEVSNLTQLQAWYLKSSDEERKAFRRWMIDQE